MPRCRREGTRKSRAPSGVLFVSMGVSTSTNPRPSKNRRIEANTRWRKRIAAVISGRRRSRYRYFSRRTSSTSTSSSTGKGGVSDSETTSTVVAATSTWPVARPGLAVPSGRRRTVPATRTTDSSFTSAATACADGASWGWATTWTIPSRSRRSRKTTPPWSRLRATHPASNTSRPASSCRSPPHMSVRPPARYARPIGPSSGPVMRAALPGQRSTSWLRRARAPPGGRRTASEGSPSPRPPPARPR